LNSPLLGPGDDVADVHVVLARDGCVEDHIVVAVGREPGRSAANRLKRPGWRRKSSWRSSGNRVSGELVGARRLEREVLLGVICEKFETNTV